MIFSLASKVAVVTGGGSGIGKAIAECFASQGATVCIIELNTESAKATADAIQKSGGKAAHFACDVSNQSATVEVMTRIAKQFNSIDILVNSAGIAKVSRLDTTSESDFEKIFQVNVKGTYNSMYAAISHMKKQNKGVILNVASIAASLGIADRFAYSMSKGAVVSMTLSVAKDYIASGVRCNSISPARIHTPFVDGFLKANYPGNEKEMFDKLSKVQPIGRMGTPLEVAHLALYLCSDEAAFVTGCDYTIDGGFTKLNG
ncbi:MAG TPA: SDR family oxidoreductase [Cyclobacteriaceae bacterium]|nr:SDR family oxidoreductase [Cyclobacteriaceae bacterium]